MNFTNSPERRLSAGRSSRMTKSLSEGIADRHVSGVATITAFTPRSAATNSARATAVKGSKRPTTTVHFESAKTECRSFNGLILFRVSNSLFQQGSEQLPLLG